MEAFAYVSCRFETELLIKIMDFNGGILHYFTCWNYKKAPEFAQSWGDRHGYKITWKPNPWTDADVMTSIASYEDQYGFTMSGREKTERFYP